MKIFTHALRSKQARFGMPLIVALVVLFTAGVLVVLVEGAHAAPTAVGLGTADSFVVLAGAGVTNTGPTTLNGDLGTFPTTSITGAGSMTITGTNHAGDSVTQGAKTDLVTAYNTAAGEGPTTPIVADLGGQTLHAGVYNSASSIGLTGTLTLDGGGNPDAVFVFQAGSTLTTASASLVSLTNGAQACNVYWQVGSSATLGTGSKFTGSVLALSDITVTTGTTIVGRMLARNGAVTLDTNTITKPTCATAAPASTTTATTTTAATTTTSAATTTAAAPASAVPVTTTTAVTTTPASAKRVAQGRAVKKTATATKAKTTVNTPAKLKRVARAQVKTTTHRLARPARHHVAVTG